MTASAFLQLAAIISLAMLALALLLTTARILIGPTLADRILALDLLSVCAMSLVGAIAIQSGYALYLDIAIALALMGFLATLAFSRYIVSRGQRQSGNSP